MTQFSSMEAISAIHSYLISENCKDAAAKIQKLVNQKLKKIDNPKSVISKILSTKVFSAEAKLGISVPSEDTNLSQTVRNPSICAFQNLKDKNKLESSLDSSDSSSDDSQVNSSKKITNQVEKSNIVKKVIMNESSSDDSSSDEELEVNKASVTKTTSAKEDKIQPKTNSSLILQQNRNNQIILNSSKSSKVKSNSSSDSDSSSSSANSNVHKKIIPSAILSTKKDSVVKKNEKGVKVGKANKPTAKSTSIQSSSATSHLSQKISNKNVLSKIIKNQQSESSSSDDSSSDEEIKQTQSSNLISQKSKNTVNTKKVENPGVKSVSKQKDTVNHLYDQSNRNQKLNTTDSSSSDDSDSTSSDEEINKPSHPPTKSGQNNTDPLAVKSAWNSNLNNKESNNIKKWGDSDSSSSDSSSEEETKIITKSKSDIQPITDKKTNSSLKADNKVNKLHSSQTSKPSLSTPVSKSVTKDTDSSSSDDSINKNEGKNIIIDNNSVINNTINRKKDSDLKSSQVSVNVPNNAQSKPNIVPSTVITAASAHAIKRSSSSSDSSSDESSTDDETLNIKSKLFTTINQSSNKKLTNKTKITKRSSSSGTSDTSSSEKESRLSPHNISNKNGIDQPQAVPKRSFQKPTSLTSSEDSSNSDNEILAKDEVTESSKLISEHKQTTIRGDQNTKETSDSSSDESFKSVKQALVNKANDKMNKIEDLSTSQTPIQIQGQSNFMSNRKQKITIPESNCSSSDETSSSDGDNSDHNSDQITPNGNTKSIVASNPTKPIEKDVSDSSDSSTSSTEDSDNQLLDDSKLKSKQPFSSKNFEDNSENDSLSSSDDDITVPPSLKNSSKVVKNNGSDVFSFKDNSSENGSNKKGRKLNDKLTNFPNISPVKVSKVDAKTQIKKETTESKTNNKSKLKSEDLFEKSQCQNSSKHEARASLQSETKTDKTIYQTPTNVASSSKLGSSSSCSSSDSDLQINEYSLLNKESIRKNSFQNGHENENKDMKSVPTFTPTKRPVDQLLNDVSLTQPPIKIKSKPFQRIANASADQLLDNAFKPTTGRDIGIKAANSFRDKRGKDFKREKNKRKRASFASGTIDTSTRSFKFNES